MSLIRKKLQHFEIEIRRSERQKILANYRSNLINLRTFDDLFQKIVIEKPHEISQIFLDSLATFPQESIEKVRSFLEDAPIVFFQKDKQYDEQWFFDCSSEPNLKLVSLLAINKWNFMQKFFKSTILAHERYKAASNKFLLQVRESKCYIQPQKMGLHDLSKQNLLSIIYQNSNENNFLATLKFWATYVSLQFDFAPLDFVVMLKTFLLWYEHTQICRYAETYFFILQMVKFIEQSSLLLTKKRDMKQLKQCCQLFISIVKKTLPNALANLLFKEIGQITIQLIKLSTKIPEILSELIFRKETIVEFLRKTFRFSLDSNNMPSIIVGIRLVYYSIQVGNILQYISLEDKTAIFQKIFDDYLFDSSLQYYAIYSLKQLASSDSNCFMETNFEGLDFSKLFSSAISKYEILIYEFCLVVLGRYKQNMSLCQKIFNNCELIKRLRKYLQDDENQQLFLYLFEIIDSSMQYYVDNWIHQVHQAREYAHQIDFEWQEQFLDQTQKYIELKIKQNQI